MRKIIHAADIHLDSPLKKLDQYDGAPAERIRGASRQALQNLTALAIDQSVDLVVIAGDLYDGDWTDQNTGLAFVKEASKLMEANIPVLVIRGNHDAANLMTSTLPLPSNPDGSELLLRSDRAETRLFESIGIAVHGQSFAKRAERSNLAEKYPDPIAGFFNLGLLHTGLEGTTAHANYAPCSPNQLADFGYDYWALGHIHQHRNHAPKGGPPIVFSGNLQGRHIAEIGPKGCCLIEIDDRNQCRYDFVPLDVLRWHQCPIDADQMQHHDDVRDAFERWVVETVDQSEGRLVIARVHLHNVDPATQLHRQSAQLLADLQAIGLSVAGESFWLEDVKLRIRTSSFQQTPMETEGPIASLKQTVHTLRESQDLAAVIESELADLHRKLPRELKDLSGDPALAFGDQDWTAALLESAAAEILNRLESPGSAAPSGGSR